MKNNLDFYYRYSNAHQHPKFKTLRARFGWEGEGRFWALNDMIADADGCVLDFNKKYLIGSIAADLGMTIEQFKDFFDFLGSDECNLIQSVGENKYTTEIVQDIYTKVAADREAARQRKRTPKTKPSTDFVKVSETSRKFTEQTKSSGEPDKKESKVKESKVKETIIRGGDLGDVDSEDTYGKISKLFISTWNRNPLNYSEILAVERMLINYNEKHIVQAFRRAAEMGKDTMNVAYVKGILKKHYEEMAVKKEKLEANKKKLENLGINPNNSTMTLR